MNATLQAQKFGCVNFLNLSTEKLQILISRAKIVSCTYIWNRNWVIILEV